MLGMGISLIPAYNAMNVCVFCRYAFSTTCPHISLKKSAGDLLTLTDCALTVP